MTELLLGIPANAYQERATSKDVSYSQTRMGPATLLWYHDKNCTVTPENHRLLAQAQSAPFSHLPSTELSSTMPRHVSRLLLTSLNVNAIYLKQSNPQNDAKSFSSL